MSRPPGVRFGRESFPEFKGETEQHVASRGFSVDSRLFAKILREGSEKQPLSTRESSTGRREDAESLHSITGQCELRLRGDGERPMVFVIHLARRGRINVIARKEHSSWCVCFAPEQTGTYQWLLVQQSRCQERLACKLGQPVRVHVLREGSG